MENQIKITRLHENAADFVFEVETKEHKYKVTFSDPYYQQLTGSKLSPEELVRKSFEFLLVREGPDSIMRQFELPVISRYFPEFEREIKKVQ